MVDAKTLVIGAAALALLLPERVGAAGVSAGTFAGGIAEGITALGTIKISPEFAPNISPRVVPELGLKIKSPVDTDPEYNSGVVCPYCYVNWFRLNVSADIAAQESTKGTISTGHEDLDVWFSSEEDSTENTSS